MPTPERPPPSAPSRDRVQPSPLLQDVSSFQAQLLDAVGQAVMATDLEGRVIFWNPAAESLYGWKREEALGRHLLEVTPAPDFVSRADEIMEQLRRGMSWSGEFEVQRKDGTRVPVLVTDTPVTDSEGNVIAIVGVSTDLTERKRLERQLLQAQRMEAVGALAGGVAHDFNNALTAIEGYLTFLEDAIGADHAARRDVDGIRTAAVRAGRLTQQLLAFSRRQVLSPRTLDLRELVRGSDDLIEMLVGRGAEVQVDLEERPVYVLADHAQLEQVVLELVTNARDASPSGAPIDIEVRAVEVEGSSPERRPEMPAGPYARISVRDRGSGMSQDVLERVYEPFFSTKPAWQGSGLGLSTAYGIVKQSGGFIYGESVPGHGSTFRIYLPRLEGPAEDRER